jgi:hypothetical protein
MTPSSIHSMRSHSGGPLGTHSYHSLLGTQYSSCSMHSHSGGLPGSIAIHSWDSCALFPGIGRSLLVLVITLSRLGYLFTWTMSVATTTDYQFICSVCSDVAALALLCSPRSCSLSRGFLATSTPTDCCFISFQRSLWHSPHPGSFIHLDHSSHGLLST